TPLGLAGQVPDLIAIYAALPTEPTPELPPPDGGDPRPYGLLTYTLGRELTRARSPLSYAGLVRRIQDQYAAWGRPYPTPLVEGRGERRSVPHTARSGRRRAAADRRPEGGAHRAPSAAGAGRLGRAARDGPPRGVPGLPGPGRRLARRGRGGPEAPSLRPPAR